MFRGSQDPNAQTSRDGGWGEMGRGHQDVGALAREMAEIAGRLASVVKAMDDLGWTTDSYSRRHLRGVVDSLRGCAARIAASQNGRTPGGEADAPASNEVEPGCAERTDVASDPDDAKKLTWRE